MLKSKIVSTGEAVPFNLIVKTAYKGVLDSVLKGLNQYHQKMPW